MPVPATTGVLRTKITDMEIGDYIKAFYTWNSISGALQANYPLIQGIGKDAESGWPGGEKPISGEATSPTESKFFYFVKVDKGLLIADRVCQHSISWDVLNAGKVIQGLPWDNGTIIPTMTSNTTPSGIVTASSIFRETWDGWRAFDKNKDTYWATASGILTGSLIYDFGSPKRISGYSLTNVDLNNNVPPKDWTFDGWDEEKGEWISLDSKTDFNLWTNNLTKFNFLLQKSETYSKFRLNITKTNNGANIGITEMQIFESAGIIRSLTGGVAYADANGNSSTTDKGNGAFPVNNEWDKYIVNFPSDKIQDGKTLDDIFHINGVATWCQDTPSIIMPSSQATARVARGHTNIDGFGYNVSNIAIEPLSCFRPVLQYKEV